MRCHFSPEAVRHEFTPLDNGFITEYLPHADGLQLQVYLYGLMQCYHPSMDGSIADALGITMQQVTEAFCYWQAQGLVRITSENPLTVEYASLHALHPQGAAAPQKYGSLIAKLNTLTAPRQFGMRELRHVYDWIEVYGLDEGAVLELVSYCLDRKGRRVSINYMSTVAQSWAEQGIVTFEAARAEIEAYALKRHGATAVLREWNLTRPPTKSEMALYEKWTSEWGFTDEAVLAALPRMTEKGKPTFSRLGEELEKMRDHAISTASDVREDDEKAEQERLFAKLLFERAGRVEPANKTERSQIRMYLEEYAMPREVLLYAADCSRGASQPYGLMKLLLNKWHGEGIKTVAEAEAFEAKEKAEKADRSAKKKPRKKYPEHTISEKDFDSMFLDLDLNMSEE